MNIILNEKKFEIGSSTSVVQLLEKIKSNKKGIAVAVNDSLVPSGEWNTYILSENDNILIITAAQGG
jgi:sulfur carrier protein